MIVKYAVMPAQSLHDGHSFARMMQDAAQAQNGIHESIESGWVSAASA